MEDIVDLIEMLNNRGLTAFWKNDCLWVIMEHEENHYKILQQLTMLEKKSGERIPLYVKFLDGDAPRFYGTLQQTARLWANFPIVSSGAGHWQGKKNMSEEQIDKLDEFIGELTLKP